MIEVFSGCIRHKSIIKVGTVCARDFNLSLTRKLQSVAEPGFLLGAQEKPGGGLI